MKTSQTDKSPLKNVPKGIKQKGSMQKGIRQEGITQESTAHEGITQEAKRHHVERHGYKIDRIQALQQHVWKFV